MCKKKKSHGQSSHPLWLDLLLNELNEVPAVSLVFLRLLKERPVERLKSQLPKMGECVFVHCMYTSIQVCMYEYVHVQVCVCL